MFDILKRFEARSPEYDSVYYEPIIFRFAVVGGDKGQEDEKQRKGKFFSNVYELYMYAAILGISQNYPVSLMPGAKRQHFIKIDEWKQHPELVKFLIMALITKADIDLNALEDMEEREIDNILTDLKKTLESYANGGFELLYRKLNSNPTYFQDDNCFINLLSDINNV
jgi:hypothetical protein